VENAMTYPQYLEITAQLLTEKRSSTTDFMDNSDDILHYASLNLARMKRLDKTTKILPETMEIVEKMDEPITLLCISEGWCGDASQVVPVVESMAKQSKKLKMRLIFRDENQEIMNAFLTNGGQAIPKFIALNAENQVLGTWGPRPQKIQDQVDIWKKEGENIPKEQRAARFEELKTEVQKWYNADKTRSIQSEFSDFLAQL
jgi:thioredoxin-like negative regulator of GroEL